MIPLVAKCHWAFLTHFNVITLIDYFKKISYTTDSTVAFSTTKIMATNLISTTIPTPTTPAQATPVQPLTMGSVIPHGSANYNKLTVSNTAKVQIVDGGDIKIGNKSLKEFMEQVEIRLNIINPHPEMENEWAELAELKKQYDAKLAECIEKSKVWKILKND